MDDWNTLVRRRMAIVFAAAIIAVIVTAAPAAARVGAIEGRVVNVTTGRAVVGADVALHLWSDQAEMGTASTTSEAGGRYSFPAPSSGVSTVAVSATYKGSEYWTDQFSAADPPAFIAVRVYDPTSNSADVSVATWVVWVDREGTGAAVQHSLRWINEGTLAYVGDAGGAQDRAVVQVPLAPEATNFQFLDLFLRSPGRVQGSSFVDDAALAPGASEGTIRYTTPDLAGLDLPITLPTRDLRVLVPQDVEVRSAELTPSGQTTAQGITYSIYLASGLAPGDRVHVAMSGLTAAGGDGDGGSSSLAAIIIGSAIVVAIGSVVVWRLGRTGGRARRRPSPVVRRSASRVGRASDRRRAAPAPSRRRRAPSSANGRRPAEPADDDIDLLIDEIAALDLAFERGLLEEHRYRALRAAAKRRLLRSREAVDQGGPAMSPGRDRRCS